MFMHITLEQARCFCALVETGNYQAAAQQMHKSHSAIVYAVSCFEKQCGVTLLNRKEYRSTLTAAGRRIYEQCRSLLESAAQLEQVCADLSSDWEPSVRLVYDGVLSPDPLLQIFNYFETQKIPTTLGFFSDFLQGVEKSFVELEAQFMISILDPKQSGLNSVALEPLTLWLVAHKTHELARKKGVWTQDQLKTFNFFTVRGADRGLDLGTKELEETSTFHLSDFGLKKSAIMKGTGFGWLPEYMIQDELKRKALIPVEWEHPHRRELLPRLYYRKRPGLGKAGQIILQEMR